MLRAPKSTKLQCAADDAGSIGDAVETLGLMLDRFYETHGQALGLRLTTLIPEHENLGLVSKRVHAFAHSLEPQE